MDTEPPPRLALALLTLDETLKQISRPVALGREAVERDPFLPLSARATMAASEPPADEEPAP